MDGLLAFFENTSWIGGAILLFWIGAGCALGIAQVFLEKSVNVWPLQLAAGSISIGLTLFLAARIGVDGYSNIVTMSALEARQLAILSTYKEVFRVLEIGVAGLVFQVISGAIGRFYFVNHAQIVGMRMQRRTAARTPPSVSKV